jgi:hypothetical protein
MNDLEKKFEKMNVQPKPATTSSDSNQNKGKSNPKHRGRRSSSTAEARKIILTVGRWQPPHNGHGLLIREVIIKSSKDPDSIGLIYIPPNAVETMGLTNSSARTDKRFNSKISKQAQKYRPDEMKVDRETAVRDEMNLELDSNPLPSIKRWYYLNLMHGNEMMDQSVVKPRAFSKFLVGEAVDKATCSRFLCGDLLTGALKWRRNKFVYFDEMTDSKRCVIARRAMVLQGKYPSFMVRTETVKTTRSHSNNLPSFKCIEFLKSRDANDIEILVGSDRVGVFGKYNPSFAKKMGATCSVTQAGRRRGARGSDSCRTLKKPVAINFSPKKKEKEKEYEALADVIDTCSTSNNSCSTLVDGQFSGTKIRECARTGNNLDYFAKGVKVPDSAMTNLDCYCLFYDLREAMGLAEFDINNYNSNISVQYRVTQKELIDNFYFHQTKKEIQETIGQRVLLDKREGLRLTVSGRRRQRELQKRERADKLNAEDLKFLRDVQKYQNDKKKMGGRRKKTRKKKRKRVPIKYVPKRLTKKDKKKARNELKKSRKAYKKGKYYTREKLKSFKSKKSSHIINAMKIYKVKSVSASAKLSKKSGCSVTGLKKLVSKGAGAYYSSGSRPNQTATSWGRARMASSITGGKASVVDYKILEKYCKPNSKALKLSKKAKKKRGYGTRKVKKVKL